MLAGVSGPCVLPPSEPEMEGEMAAGGGGADLGDSAPEAAGASALKGDSRMRADGDNALAVAIGAPNAMRVASVARSGRCPRVGRRLSSALESGYARAPELRARTTDATQMAPPSATPLKFATEKAIERGRRRLGAQNDALPRSGHAQKIGAQVRRVDTAMPKHARHTQGLRRSPTRANFQKRPRNLQIMSAMCDEQLA